MKLRKTQVAAAVGAALFVAGTTVYAQANPTVQLYGQVSRALMFADDGSQSKWFHVDSEASGTRLGATGGGTAMPGLRFGFRLEFDFQSNESQLVNFNGATGATSNNPAHVSGAGFSERHADAWLDGAWGRLSIGQGDGAANGASESDLSGTGMANGIGVADYGGGIAFRDSAGAFTANTVGNTINQQDFESRYDRLMYTTPNFGGFRAQVSHGQKDNADVREASVWYGGKMGGLGEIAAALGWSEQKGLLGATTDETFGGSVSWLHASGFNLTYSYTNREASVTPPTAARDSTFNYFKVGYKMGQHAIGIDYSIGDDFRANGDEAKMYGIGYVWSPLRGLELYAAYKVHQLDVAGGSLEDIKIGTLGTRVRF